MTTDVYAPFPGLTLAVSGAKQARQHFAQEYGAARCAGVDHRGADVHVHVEFATRLPAGGTHGGHKTVRWSVQVEPPGHRPTTARIVLAGRPRRFALSLVQGFVVEPLVSLAVARSGGVLLPAAALERTTGAVIVLGRSGAGKTSVVARAIAAGHGALGDDQVLLDELGGLWPWPRRLRVYPDLRSTAPAAVEALPHDRRAALSGLAVLSAATRGWVAPSLPLHWRDLGGTPLPGPVPVHRVVVVERGGAADTVVVTPLDQAAVLRLAADVLAEQRSRLQTALGATWGPEMHATAAREAKALATALGSVPSELWQLPQSWPAARAVQALADRLSLASPVTRPQRTLRARRASARP